MARVTTAASMLIALLVSPFTASAVDRFVSPDGLDTGYCNVSTTPCRSIQRAVDMAQNGDVIKVAAGSYYSRTLIYRSAPTLRIEGGWSGGFTSRLDYAGNTRLAYYTGAGTEPGGVFLIVGANRSIDVTIDGLFIASTAAGYGGAISVRSTYGGSAHVVLNNVILQGNAAWSGGAIDVQSNTGGTASLEVRNSLISSNSTFAGDGGAVSAFATDGTVTLNLVRNEFRSNVSTPGTTSFGGALYLESAGTGRLDLTSTANRYLYNKAPSGGAIAFLARSGQVNVASTNDVIAHNTAAGTGGGLEADADDGTVSVKIVNSTIADNSRGGIYSNRMNMGAGTVTMDLTNTILWGNRIVVDLVIDTLTSARAAYSDIGTIGNTTYGGTYTDGGNNLSTDPLFVDASTNDYRIRGFSPAVDAGICGVLLRSAIDPRYSRYLRVAPYDDQDLLTTDPRPRWGVLTGCDIGADELDPPGIATPTAPSGAIVLAPGARTNLRWNADVLAADYDLAILGDGGAFVWQGSAAAVAAGCASGTGSCSMLGPALAPGNYWFSVAARNSTGQSSGGLIAFTILGPPPTPFPMSPSGDGSSTPVFQWPSSLRADSYIVTLRDAGGAPVQSWNVTAAGANCAAGGTCQLASGLSLTPGSWQWQVQACAAIVGCSVPSGLATFLVWPLEIRQLMPVPGGIIGAPLRLCAIVRNNMATTGPATANGWFAVAGPGLGSSGWVWAGFVPAGNLAAGAEVPVCFDWNAAPRPGTFSYTVRIVDADGVTLWSQQLPWLHFTVGFDTQFNSGTFEGWTQVPNSTWIPDGTTLYADGYDGKSLSLAYGDSTYGFADVDYSVRMYQAVCADCVNWIAIRGTVQPIDATNRWYEGYFFGFTRSGRYVVSRLIPGGGEQFIANSSSPAVAAGDQWNTLRVIAVGADVRFLVNGTEVWRGSLPDYDWTQVGIGFDRIAGSGNRLRVDWARLAGPQ